MFHFDPHTDHENEPQIFMVLAEILLAKKNMVENIKIIKKPYDIYFHQILITVHNKGKILKKDLYFYLHEQTLKDVCIKLINEINCYICR